MSDPLKPELTLLVKLGSIAVHADEFIDSGHAFDKLAIVGLLEDDEIKQWIKAMGVYMPLKRS